MTRIDTAQRSCCGPKKRQTRSAHNAIPAFPTSARSVVDESCTSAIVQQQLCATLAPTAGSTQRYPGRSAISDDAYPMRSSSHFTTHATRETSRLHRACSTSWNSWPCARQRVRVAGSAARRKAWSRRMNGSGSYSTRRRGTVDDGHRPVTQPTGGEPRCSEDARNDPARDSAFGGSGLSHPHNSILVPSPTPGHQKLACPPGSAESTLPDPRAFSQQVARRERPNEEGW